MSKRRRRPPVVRWLRPCPDCCAQFIGRELHHEDTCPLAEAVERVCDQDRAYFEQHPNEPRYTRPISRAEIAALEHIDPGRVATHVIVTNAPWGRIRSFMRDGLIGSLMLDAAS